MRILLTGATGMVGSMLLTRLAGEGIHVTVAGRSRPEGVLAGDFLSFDLGAADRLGDDALRGVSHVIHLAAQVHLMKPTRDQRRGFGDLNARATEILARRAAHAGVQRFVLVSSIKVNGEATAAKPFTADDVPRPVDPYAISKHDAERMLATVAAESDMQFAIVRPPLVYGPGVRGNFLRLLRIVDRELPLPLGAIDNRRSLVSAWNLCDLLLHVTRHPAAHGHVWLVRDGEDLSTRQLLRSLAEKMGRRSRLLSTPPRLLETIARITGFGGEFERLAGSLCVDDAATRRVTAWQPPLTLDEGLARTVAWYLQLRAAT